MQEPERFVHKLKKPVVIRNKDGVELETISELKMRELVGGDADRITADKPVPMMVQMVGASADLPPHVIAKIPLFELLAAGGAAAEKGFFADIQAIPTK